MPWTDVQLRTSRLILRCPTNDDKPTVRDLLTDPAVRKFLGGPADDEVVAELDEATLGELWGAFTVVEQEGGRAIGTCTLSRARGLLEISYMLLSTYWRRGLGREAVSAITDWAWINTDDDCLIAVTQVANDGSLQLLRELGFADEIEFEEHGAVQMLLRLDRPDGR